MADLGGMGDCCLRRDIAANVLSGSKQEGPSADAFSVAHVVAADCLVFDQAQRVAAAADFSAG